MSDRTIWDIKNPDGSRRFYPASEHPASAEARAQLKRLEDWKITHSETAESRQYESYLLFQVEAVEKGEAQARAIAEARLRDRNA